MIATAHPVVPRHVIAVTALVRRSDGCVLLIDSPWRGWEPPGGQVEEGETLDAAFFPASMMAVRRSNALSCERANASACAKPRRSKVMRGFAPRGRFTSPSSFEVAPTRTATGVTYRSFTSRHEVARAVRHVGSAQKELLSSQGAQNERCGRQVPNVHAVADSSGEIAR